MRGGQISLGNTNHCDSGSPTFDMHRQKQKGRFLNSAMPNGPANYIAYIFSRLECKRTGKPTRKQTHIFASRSTGKPTHKQTRTNVFGFSLNANSCMKLFDI